MQRLMITCSNDHVIKQGCQHNDNISRVQMIYIDHTNFMDADRLNVIISIFTKYWLTVRGEDSEDIIKAYVLYVYYVLSRILNVKC